MTNLTNLSLTGNYLVELPGVVSNLTRLRELTITGNEVRS
jgi:Leucine-rich repeat (LRR) protein